MEIATYVLDINGEPLMLMSSYKRVRKLLKNNKAKVVRREPFTIKLLYEPKTKIIQPLGLGVDTGSDTFGTAVVGNEKTYYASEVQVRNDITPTLESRSKSRRNRRSRKTRYRPVRFDNKKNSKKKDRYSPTLVSKYESHEKEINFICSILPIAYIVLECGQFDPHLLKMQEEGKPFNRRWGYQKGEKYGFSNAREACLNRDSYICQFCKKGNITLNAHHIIYRSEGGADTLDNLITLCEKHHRDLHAGRLPEEFINSLEGKKKGQLKHATQMNILRSMLLKHYPDAIETHGYVTKENRWKLGWEKTHYIDAIVIASGGQRVNLPEYVYYKKSVSKGDYQQTKYWSKSKNGVNYRKLTTGKIAGFRKFDKVRYLGNEYFIKGRSKTSPFRLMDIHGNNVTFENISDYKYARTKDLVRVSARKTTLCIKQKVTANSTC